MKAKCRISIDFDFSFFFVRSNSAISTSHFAEVFGQENCERPKDARSEKPSKANAA